jgi:metal-responsive CopG/Arc/MetJ family transcriptional regulator
LKKFVGVKVEDGVYEKLQEFKRERKYSSDSAAVREILRHYLLDIWPKERAQAEVIADEN